jgi:PAS domain S-box-containing protein
MTTATPASRFPGTAVLDLQRVSARISSDLTPAESARVMLDHATTALGAKRAHAILESPEGEIEWLVGTDDVEARGSSIPAEYRGSVQAIADIREPVFLGRDEEIDARYPILAAHRPSGGALAVLPLTAGNHDLGSLLIVFPWQGEFSAGDRDLLTAFGDVSGGVIERSRLAARERLARGRLSFVSEASRALAESLDLNVTLRTAASLAIPLLADGAIVDMLGEGGRFERVVDLGASSSDDAEVLEASVPLPASASTDGALADAGGADGRNGTDEAAEGRAPTLRAMVAGRTIAYEVRATAPRGRGRSPAPAEGGGHAITSPLVLGGEPFGAITLYRSSGEPYSDEEIAAAEEFARRAARAIENSRLHSDRQRALREAEALARLNRAVAEARSPDEIGGLLLDEVLPILDAPRGGVFLYDRESNDLVAARTRGYRARPGDHVPIAGTPAEEALGTGATVVTGRSEWGTRYAAPPELGLPASPSFVVVPLIVGGEPLGLVAVGFDDVRELRQPLLATVRGLIDAGAQAIARASLIDAERRTRERESGVVRLSEAVADARSPEDVARVLLAEIYERFEPRSASVALLDDAASEFVLVGVLTGTSPRPEIRPRWPVSMASAASDVIRTRAPLVLDEATYRSRYPDVSAIEDPAGTATYVALPLLSGVRAVGALALSFKEQRVVARAELDDLRALAEAGGQAVEQARLREGERRALGLLEAVVAELPIGVIVAEAGSGRVLNANAAVADMLGWQPVFGSHVADGRIRLELPDGRPIPDADMPLVRALRDGTETPSTEVSVVRDDGAVRRVLLAALPVRDDSGRLLAAAGIWTDITEQRAAEEAREAFLGILSHELRTPITSILAGSNILLHRSLEGSEADLVDDINAEAERLHWLVENLLVLSRVERGADLRRSDPVLVQHVGRRVMAHEASRWPDRQFAAAIPVGLPAASGDEAYIEQILRNLLTNAAKYSPPGSTVELAVSGEEDGVVIRVLDRGPGFAADDVGRVFDLFYRSPSAIKVAAGAGIGLYTSRVLAEAMGGRIWAANREPDGGAEVGVWLPVASLDPEH